MEAFELLKEDHGEARTLLQRLRTGAAERRDFVRLKDILDSHRRLEEEIFYPALMHTEGTSEHIKQALNEHAGVERLLEQMNAMSFGDQAWKAQLDDLERRVEAHISHEENELLPQAGQILSTRLREDLGARMQARREGLGAESYAGAGGYVAGASALGSRTERRVSVWRDKAQEKGREFFHQQSEQAAERVHGLAEALRETANTLSSRDQIYGSRYLEQAAGGLDRVSQLVRDREPEEIVHEVASFARRRPAIFLGTAAAAGFLLARFLKSEPPDRAGVPMTVGEHWPQTPHTEVH